MCPHVLSAPRVICVPGDLDAAGIEQKRKDLEEIDALRQRNARELFFVMDTELTANRWAGYSFMNMSSRAGARR